MTTEAVLDQLGGTAGLTEAVGNLYGRILDDAELAGYFEDVHFPTLHAHMVAFLRAALTGSATDYPGRPLDVAHRRLNITDSAFDRVAAHLQAVLMDADAPPTAVAAVLARVAPLRPLIVTAG